VKKGRKNMRASRIAVVTCLLVLSSYGVSVAQMDSNPSNVKVVGGVLTDSNGMTLYTFDKDTVPGKSACNGQCLVNWPALSVAADAGAVGDWTIITRDDGSKQWAHKGKPLYTYAHDAKPGDTTGDGKGTVWHTATP
jgi:predicted lipoprotein with Yx(FWY)xxD motif